MQGWRTQFASDLMNDGMGLELFDTEDQLVAEVFRCDADHSVTLSVYDAHLPEDVKSWLCALAQAKLGPFEDGQPLPPRQAWREAAA